MMGEGKGRVFEGPKFKAHNIVKQEEEDEDQEDQGLSWGSSSSSFSSLGTMEDEDDDASSSSPPSSPNSTPSSLNNLSQLMAQLPIKGLSKFYNGKSESFTNLARVTSMEDIVKKENPFNIRRRMLKACKSHGNGLDSYKSHTAPKPIISKKNSLLLNRRPSFLTVSRPPPVP